MRSHSLFLAAALALVASVHLSCSSEEEGSAEPSAQLESEDRANGSRSSVLDWPQWRGPERDGRSGAATIRWPETLTRLWSVDAGRGYSSPVVANGVVYLYEQRDKQEVLRALEIASGRELWHTGNQVLFQTFSGSVLDGLKVEAADLGGGPYATPLVDQEVVYSLGFNGVLEGRRALDGGLLCEFETHHSRPMHGSAMSPLLLNRGIVVVHVGGGRTGEMVAYSCERQEVVWSWPGDASGYASPVVANIDGSRQVVALTDRFAMGLAADSGELLWQLPFSDESNESMITPVIHQDLVLFAGVRRGTLAVRPSRTGAEWEPRLAWQRPERTFYMSSPVLFKGMLVGLSDKRKGQLVALDASSGEDRFVGVGRFAESASLVVVGEHLLGLTVEGELVVWDWQADSLKEIARYAVAETSVWAHLAVSGDVLLIRGREPTHSLACLGCCRVSPNPIQ